MNDYYSNPHKRPYHEGQLNIDDLVPGLCFVRMASSNEVVLPTTTIYEVVGLEVGGPGMMLCYSPLTGMGSVGIGMVTSYLTDLGVLPYIGDGGVPNWNATNWIKQVDRPLPPVQLPDVTTRRWYFDYPEDTEAPIISSNLYGDADRNPRYRLTEVIVETLPKGKGSNYNVELIGRNIQSRQLHQIYNDAFKKKVEAELIKKYGDD